jgi:hypothetical protein
MVNAVGKRKAVSVLSMVCFRKDQPHCPERDREKFLLFLSLLHYLYHLNNFKVYML